MLSGMLMQSAMLFLIVEPHTLNWLDPVNYLRIARELANGLPYSSYDVQRNLYQSPGYPYILSFLIRLFGDDIVKIRIFHILLFPFFLWSLYLLGSKWRNQFTGLLFAFMGIIYPFYIYVPLTLYPESILIYLIPVTVLLMYENSKKINPLTLLVSGIIFTIAIMIRPTAVVILLVFIVYVSFRSGFSWKKLLITTILAGFLPVASVTAWIYNNYQIHGTPVFSLAGDYNLLLSYNDNASIKVKADYPLPDSVQTHLDKANSHIEFSKIAKNEAHLFIRKHPLKFLKLVILKQIDLWNPFPRTTTKTGFANMKYKIFAAIPYLFFLITGIVGFVKNKKNYFTIALLMIVILNSSINGFFAVSVRYRLITDFIFILFAADAIYDRLSANMKQKLTDASSSIS